MSSFSLDIDINWMLWWVKKIDSLIESKLFLALRECWNILLEELKRNTPEDTREMLNSYKVIDVQRKWDLFILTIWNKADHSIYVEFWVSWKVYNYHKPKWSIFYTGKGNETFQRSLDNVQNKIYDVIMKYLWQIE